MTKIKEYSKKCCGNCYQFTNEDTNGLGICNVHDESRMCSEYCDWHDEYTKEQRQADKIKYPHSGEMD